MSWRCSRGHAGQKPSRVGVSLGDGDASGWLVTIMRATALVGTEFDDASYRRGRKKQLAQGFLALSTHTSRPLCSGMDSSQRCQNCSKCPRRLAVPPQEPGAQQLGWRIDQRHSWGLVGKGHQRGKQGARHRRRKSRVSRGHGRKEPATE